MWIFSLLFAAWLLMEIIFLPYQYRWKRKLDSREHPFRILYGPGIWLCHVIYDKQKRQPNRHIAGNLRLLTGKENIRDEYRLFFIGRTTTVILCLGLTFGICAVLQSTAASTQIKSLFRPEAGEEEEQILAVAETEDETLDISLTVSAVKLREDEIRDILEQGVPLALETALGENPSFLEITEPLNFVDSVTVEPLTLSASWAVSCTDYIRYDGTLEEVEENVEGVLYLTLWYGDYEVTEQTEICLIPAESEEVRSIQEAVQEYIDQEELACETAVTLPEEIDGKKVTFYSKESSPVIWTAVLGCTVAVLLWIQKKKKMDETLSKRSGQLQQDYSEVVLRIALLQEAGMSMYNIWERLVKKYEKDGAGSRYVYEEMKLALRKMKNGTPEVTAFMEFGKRCGGANFIRFSGLLEQNIRRGSRGFSELLYQEASEAMQEEKNQVRKKGEEMNSKLLLPMGILLVLLLAMILVPSFLMMDIG